MNSLSIISICVLVFYCVAGTIVAVNYCKRIIESHKIETERNERKAVLLISKDIEILMLRDEAVRRGRKIKELEKQVKLLTPKTDEV